MASGNDLFRREVADFRRDRLHGDVSISIPTSWQLVGFLLLGIAMIAILFLSIASYARVETVPGSIALDTGVVRAVPPRAGVVSSIRVEDGQHVVAGQTLITVRSDEDMAEGMTTPLRMAAALKAQDVSLASQAASLRAAIASDRARLTAQKEGIAAEIHDLNVQVADQQRLLDTARKQYDEAMRIAERGFISRRDMIALESGFLAKRQQLAQLRQAISAKSAESASLAKEIEQSASTTGAQVANAESARAAVSQQLAQVDESRGYALKARVAGTVTALTARVGQPVIVGEPALLVVPRGSRLIVELDVPTSAAGFLALGQTVSVAVDAFPYQSFGTLKANIVRISSAASMKQMSNGPLPYYIVQATLSREWIDAFGRRQRLAPGMTLTGRIATDRRNLIQWLFEPFYAVGRR